MAGGRGGGYYGGYGGTYGQVGSPGDFKSGYGGGGGGAGSAGGAGTDPNGQLPAGGTAPGGDGADTTSPNQGGGGGAGGANGTTAAPTGGAGGRGGNGAYGGGGGAGGYGLVLTGSFTTAGDVRGGAGGDGGSGASGGGVGGDGGIGVYIRAGSNITFTNAHGIQAGSGGNGAFGGDGIRSTVAAMLINEAGGSITGGQGYLGGIGVNVDESSSVSNAGTIRGGDGGSVGGFGIGAGENSRIINEGTVSGGQSQRDGGAGIYAQAGSYIRTNNFVSGGTGGRDGGDGISGYGSEVVVAGGTVTGGDGNGGFAGDGIYARSSNISITSGMVQGGSGKYGGNGINSAYSTVTITGGSVAGGNATVGSSNYGVGVYGYHSTLISDRSISGGLYGTNRLNAVTFSGQTNTLAIGSKAGFNGAVEIKIHGGGGTLTFDQSKGDGFSADATLSANLIGDGSIIKVGAGTLTLSGTANTFSGGTTLRAGAIDLAAAGAGGTGAISFQADGGQNARLILETSAQNIGSTFGNTLDSFGGGDSLDLRGWTFSASTRVTYDAAVHILSVSDGSRTERFNLTNETPGSGNRFFAQSDADGTGTLVTNAAAVCFAGGTLIRTARGEVAVEDLAVGDLVITTSGTHRPIRWLGHRAVDCRSHPRPWEVWPVRVAAHAFGADRPARDLRVSPGHALCVDVLGEMLIPAIALINGTTVRLEDVDSVTYWHVELDSHDILLAETMPAESYLEMGNRGFFAEAAVVALDASPDVPAATHADFCRPFHMDGVIVEAVRAQLAARARRLGWRLEVPELDDVHLVVDGVRVDGCVRGLELRFPVPAGAKRVWMVSDTGSPSDVGDSLDARQLGLAVARLVVDEGFSAPRVIAHDDERLCVGFHPAEAACRWTAGRALLPAELWAGADDVFFLRAELHCGRLPRWVAPVAARADATRGGLTRVA